MSEEMSGSKSWLSFDEQLDLLVRRGLVVSDREVALGALSRIGYYRLSGYFYPFRKFHASGGRADEFYEGVTLQMVVDLYLFDKALRLLAFDALERIEMAVRVDLAYLLGKKDPYAHLKPEFFNKKFREGLADKSNREAGTNYDAWMGSYHRQRERARQLPFVKHHEEKYGGKLPIWVAIEIFDFGMMSKLFSGLLNEDKNQIANKYGAENGAEFTKWLRGLNFVRNVSAHHVRLWNTAVAGGFRVSLLGENWARHDQNRAFLYFCLMKKMLNVICPKSKWSERLIALLKTFPETNEILSLDAFGMNCSIDDLEQWWHWES